MKGVEKDLDEFIEVVGRKQPKRLPHLSEFLEQIFDTWGGSRNIAQSLHTIFSQGTPHIKARIMQCIVALIQANASLHSGIPEELGMLNEDDLRNAAMSLVGSIINGQKADPPAAGASSSTAATDIKDT
ncbi:MAG: hypothetical protein L0387_44145 [Acidobacteria bacterium]|nr:hypothetical protein [Acidobacteriota bacterium]